MQVKPDAYIKMTSTVSVEAAAADEFSAESGAAEAEAEATS